ncbi:MAG TPA: hypothetical protein VGP25_09190 [Gemmatimonadaceae bacterium]|jgi:hypothetical protein|nr:hypothetical protein [Gemmatimonadaceae bacterium]
MRNTLLGVALLVLPLAACKKTGDNEYQVKTPEVNVSTDSHTVRTPSVDVGTKKDTISTPVVGTKKDTIIVDKPVIGTKKTEVTTPTVKVTKP